VVRIAAGTWTLLGITAMLHQNGFCMGVLV
jgi:hypothetical protein